jgi:hypothetical protein
MFDNFFVVLYSGIFFVTFLLAAQINDSYLEI